MRMDVDQLIGQRKAIRTKLMQRSLSASPRDLNLEMDYRPNEDPAALVDMGEALERNLITMDANGLAQGQVAGQPWSDFYWPTSAGLAGNRYADPGFPNDWDARYEYVTQRSAAAILAAQNPDHIDSLSPVEKYDLLLRDDRGSLTAAMWAEGREMRERGLNIPAWAGICDGWAAASIMVPRPQKAVMFRAATGQEVTLYPSDIKALLSLLWARGDAPVRHLGGRCNDVYPTKDEAGRLSSPPCFDNNPGAWHLAVVNQIGVARRGLIMDASYDYQVWNQPILAYSYRYFNPQTGQSADTLQEGMVAVNALPEDRFKALRSSAAAHVVGITMDVTYLSETRPTHALSDTPSDDVKTTIRYAYDLELDAEGKVVGGEWHQENHPDFLWVPVVDATVSSIGESYFQGEWNISDQLPQSWVVPARVAAQKGQPAARILKAILDQSHGP